MFWFTSFPICESKRPFLFSYNRVAVSGVLDCGAIVLPHPFSTTWSSLAMTAWLILKWTWNNSKSSLIQGKWWLGKAPEKTSTGGGGKRLVLAIHLQSVKSKLDTYSDRTRHQIPIPHFSKNPFLVKANVVDILSIMFMLFVAKWASGLIQK